MSIIIDAKGLSCPQPVLMTVNEMKKIQTGEIIILVDTVASRENVSRAAVSQGWTVNKIEQEKEGFRISIEKG